MRHSRSGTLAKSESLLWVLLRTPALLSLTATAFVLLAQYWWFFDLFANFRIQLFAFQLILLFGFLVIRRPVWAIAMGAACILNGIAVRDYMLSTGSYVADDGQPAEIRVLTTNVLATNENADALINLITATEPDVFAVLELTENFAQALSALDRAYPHQALAPELGNFGIGVYSRLPFTRTDVLDLYGYAAIDAQISDGDASWRFVTAHPMPPMTAELAALRNRQLTSLAEHVAAIDTDYMVVGDLNMAPFSPTFAAFLARARLHDSLRGRGFHYTWPTSFPLLGIPIDHVLLSSGFEAVDYFRGSDVGSDHFPVIVDINRNRNSLD